MLSGKELMVGDYVDMNDGDYIVVPGVVKEIRGEGEQLTISINGDKVFDVCADKDINPIILSKEFFLKNGFVELYKNEQGTKLYNLDFDLMVTIYNDIFSRYRVNDMEIDYVHQFQHYLRLINLFDYANNLKIE